MYHSKVKYSIALQRGWELKELDPVVRRLTNRATRIRLTGRSTDSRIADIMIRRNTAAFIKGLQNFNALQNDDMQIRILSQKLLDCETAGIRIEAGTRVQKGQVIATAGDTALSEISEDSHLHFELSVNGESVDPSDYIEFSKSISSN